ncbi:MAG: glycosyltransferase [Polyangia bacterium]|jgi:UDP:flavonoid glycosyltransferase YjiC (YdhE family)|nr:glycosyltransferase [Polyangia bacterium]
MIEANPYLVPLPSPAQTDVAYVAVAEARGHLMRASQVCQMLHAEGLRVAPMVFGPHAVEFFQGASGMEAEELSFGYSNAYGLDHSLDVTKTTHNILTYTFSATGARDMAAIMRRMSSARVLLNDLSTSPPMAALARLIGGPHLINVVSENTYYALVNLDKLCENKTKGAISKKFLDAMFYAATVNLVNTMDRSKWFKKEGVLHYLPPFVQTESTARPSPCSWQGPSRSSKRLFVAYFNPEYRNKAFIGHLIELARRHDAFLHLVSEHAADWHSDLASDRVQIVKQDFGMATLVRKADLVITAAGLALPLQAYVAGTPLLVVVNRGHVEHARNADVIAREGMGAVVDNWEDAPKGAAEALGMVTEPHLDLPARTIAAWRSEILALTSATEPVMRGPMPMIRSFREPLYCD